MSSVLKETLMMNGLQYSFAHEHNLIKSHYFVDSYIIKFYWNVGSFKSNAKLVHGNKLFEEKNVIDIFVLRKDISKYQLIFKYFQTFI